MYGCECWTIKKAEHQRTDVKSQLIGKDPDSGIDWGLEEKIVTEDEMVGWHHWLNGQEFKFWELVMDREAWHATVHGVTTDTTEWLNWTELRLVITFLPRSKRLLISWLQSPSAVILKSKKIKSVTVTVVSPSIWHEVMGPDACMAIEVIKSVGEIDCGK